MDYLTEFWIEGKRYSYVIRDMSNPEGALEDNLYRLKNDLFKNEEKLPSSITAFVLNLEGKIWLYVLNKKPFREDYEVRLVGKPDDKYTLSKYQVDVLFSGAFPIRSVVLDDELKKLGVL